MPENHQNLVESPADKAQLLDCLYRSLLAYSKELAARYNISTEEKQVIENNELLYDHIQQSNHEQVQHS